MKCFGVVLDELTQHVLDMCRGDCSVVAEDAVELRRKNS